MNERAFKSVMRDPRLSPAAKVLWALYASYAAPATGARESDTTMAAHMNRGVRTVQDARAALMRHGYLLQTLHGPAVAEYFPVSPRANDGRNSQPTKPEPLRMATNDVPGANPRNMDQLDIGCWAEDDKGESMILVVGREDKRVVFDMYDLTNDMFYRDAMIDAEFKKQFSVPPTGKSKVRWTWHDKTPFPFDRVMKRFRRPVPQHADVQDQLSAAEKVARDLHMRGRRLTEEDITPQVEQRRARGRSIMDRIGRAVAAFRE